MLSSGLIGLARGHIVARRLDDLVDVAREHGRVVRVAGGVRKRGLNRRAVVDVDAVADQCPRAVGSAAALVRAVGRLSACREELLDRIEVRRWRQARGAPLRITEGALRITGIKKSLPKPLQPFQV